MYVAPRYHTNQVPIMKGWADMGTQAKFMVAYIGGIESHDYVDLHQMKPSWITRIVNSYLKRRYDRPTAQYKSGTYYIPSFIDLYKQLKSFRPDIVILRNYSLGNMKFVLVCRMLGIRNLIIYLQEPLYGEPIRSNFVKRIVQRIFFPSAVFTPVLYKGKERTKERLSGRAKYFVPLICDNSVEMSKEYCPEGKIRILDVGKYRPYKNHFFIVDALSQVKHPEMFEMTIIGQLSNSVEQAYFDKLNAYVKEKGLERIVRLRGNVDYKEMNEVYREHDVLIIASRELASISVLEAMSKGLCVVSSIDNGTSCYLDEYNCGITYNVEQINTIVEVLNSFSKDTEPIKTFGNLAQQIAIKQFGFNSYYAGLKDILKREYGYQ